MARRQHLTLTLMAVLVFLGLTYHISTRPSDASPMRAYDDKYSPAGGSTGGSSGGHNPVPGVSDSILTGGSIAPKLENATAKYAPSFPSTPPIPANTLPPTRRAELGRASWRLFHTMMARFPEEPSADDSLALKTYIQLFARLYPCGDCASHFQKLLQKYPPQTNSRNAAAGWACFVHNEVNKRLKKAEFDCNKLGDAYDCGCGDEDGKGKGKGKEGDAEAEAEGRKGDELKGREGVTLEKEDGLIRGG